MNVEIVRNFGANFAGSGGEGDGDGTGFCDESGDRLGGDGEDVEGCSDGGVAGKGDFSLRGKDIDFSLGRVRS